MVSVKTAPTIREGNQFVSGVNGGKITCKDCKNRFWCLEWTRMYICRSFEKDVYDTGKEVRENESDRIQNESRQRNQKRA